MTADTLEGAWQAARARWSSAIELKTPKAVTDGQAIAYINLTERQTFVDRARLDQLGIGHCLEALLAHEVGHHIRYPHTLIRARQHTRFLRSELTELARLWDCPALAEAATQGRCDFVLNLLYDLLINTDLRPWYEAQFITLYKKLAGRGRDPVFAFYLALYEALWYLPDGALVTRAMAESLDKCDPNWRGAAAACAQFIANRPDNRPLQLVRLLIALRPFLVASALDAAAKASPEGNGGFGGELAPEDVARVLREC
ncbi:MAG: hypothetical protein KC620_07240, partial [Myxococcales bacterium]|nr:hypothetical protein [Myxococcales bacterium]